VQQILLDQEFVHISQRHVDAEESQYLERLPHRPRPVAAYYAAGFVADSL
jgi:hypothetical protein